MKRIITVITAAALLALAAERPATAGSAARHRWEGATLTFGGLYVLGGNFPLLPSFIHEPLSLMTLGLGSSIHDRLFHRGYRPGYPRYLRGGYAGHDHPYLRYSPDGRAYPTGAEPYTTRVWVPGKNTPQGYLEGYWEVRVIGGPSLYSAKPSDVKSE